MEQLTLGIDDAGRGPLIGPMILAGVLVNKEQEKTLKKQGISDSKKLLHSNRIKMHKLIIENSLSYFLVITEPDEIDNSIKKGTNLNTLEAIKTAEIINKLYTGQKINVIVDCPSVNTTAWRKTLIGYIENTKNLDIKCEHKADANHISVSAASILAKVERENQVINLKNKYGNFGSGYPSDPFTKKFLKEKGEVLKQSKIFRKSWATWKKLYPDNGQSKLFK